MSKTLHKCSCLARSSLPVHDKRMDIYAFTGGDSREPEVVALVNGFRRRSYHPPVVRMHSACFTGDILGSEKCDCGPQLHASLDIISRAPWGVLLYFLRHEGRGIGLVKKLHAYALQDEGFDTVTANAELHAPIDGREYETGVAALEYLGVTDVWLLSNNPSKATYLVQHGIGVAGVQRLVAGRTKHNLQYLDVKSKVFHHNLDL